MNNLTSYNPEIQALLNQSKDLRDFMNVLEIQGDLWDKEDLDFYLYLEDLLMEMDEELHFLQINEFF